MATSTPLSLSPCRVRDSDGAEGVGYTYTVGRNGGAVADILRWEIPELVEDRTPTIPRRSGSASGGALHYGGRGGASVLALSALDIALWDLKARRANLPLWRLLGGFDRPRALLCRRHRPRSLRRGAAEANRRQSRQGLSRHQDEGRPSRSCRSDVARVQAMREHLGEGFPLMADANMKWTVEEAIRAARAFAALRPYLARGADHPRRCRRPSPDPAPGGIPIAAGENLRSLWEFKNYIAADARVLSRARCHQLRRGDRRS